MFRCAQAHECLVYDLLKRTPVLCYWSVVSVCCMLFLKCSIVALRPVSMSVFGFQSNRFFAFVMSGSLLIGSFSGMSL